MKALGFNFSRCNGPNISLLLFLHQHNKKRIFHFNALLVGKNLIQKTALSFSFNNWDKDLITFGQSRKCTEGKLPKN